ncbi:MAG: DUF58 domain-containing protein [Mycobacterium sp.]|nr:DUF58 domain-containing protein [Mycobacterium sp.]
MGGGFDDDGSNDEGAQAATARRVEVGLVWRTSALARALFICAAVALAAAMLPGRWQLVAFAAPILGVLSSLGWQRLPTAMEVVARPAESRCFERETVRVVVELGADPGAAAVDLRLTAATGMKIEAFDDGAAIRCTAVLSAPRWGRYPLQAHLAVVAPGGLLTASASAEVAEVSVFPTAPAPSTAIPRGEVPDRLGTHLTRHTGPGVEYADIRAYVPGDPLRTVNWPVSARRGALHVTERLTDRSVDVVVLVDMGAQPPGPATAATQRAVEGAVQVVQSALRCGDRAGLVTLGGGRPLWLGPDIGQRQFYRVCAAVLGMAGRPVRTTLAPGAAVPPGAVVVAFSTLLNTSFALALIELSRRRHSVVVVDVLEGYPLEGETDPLLQKMWMLERSTMYRDMRVMGVEVVSWPAEVPLDHAMRLLPDDRGRRR